MSILDILQGAGDPNAIGPYNPATDPTSMGLAGLASGFAQAAMPGIHGRIPFGAALGMAAGGQAQGYQDAIRNQGAQAQAQAAQMQNQLMRATMPALAQAYQQSASGSSGGAYGPMDALRDAMMARIRGDGRGYSAAMDTYRGMVGPGGMWNGNSVVGVPGAADVAAARAGGVSGSEAAAKVAPNLQTSAGQSAIAVNQAWQMLTPEALNALTKAGINASTAWQTPQAYQPGTTVGTPAQLQGAGGIPGIAARINQLEGTGSDPRAPNTVGGFQPGTWLSSIRAAMPAFASTPDAQLLAMRGDPNLRQMATQAYAQQNAQALQGAGLPVTAGTLYLAHGFGANGAQRLLTADPNMPIASLMAPDVATQYPGMTVGQIRQMFDQKMGAAGTPPVGGSGVGSVGTSPPAVGMPAQVPPAPQVARADAEAAATGGEDAKLMPQLDAQARESTNALVRIQQVQQALAQAQKGGIGTGYFSPELAQAAAAAKSLGIDTTALGINPAAVGSSQAAREGMVQISGEMLKRIFPSRITNMDLKLYGESLPNMGLDPAAINQVLGIAQQQAQYDVDTARSAHQWRSAHNGALAGWQDQYYGAGNYGPPNLFAAIQGNGATQPAAPSAAPPAQAPAFSEGATATNQRTGARIVFRGGKWVPM